MSDPDRFELRCGVHGQRPWWRDGHCICPELRAAESSALERAAHVCDAHLEYFAAQRIRALIPPAAAPAAEQWVWGTCVDCPRDPGEYHHPHPEYCKYRDRYDHKIPWEGRRAPEREGELQRTVHGEEDAVPGEREESAAETGKAQK